MSGRPIVRIEHNDTELRFRDKVNQNFATLARPEKYDSAFSRMLDGSVTISDIIEILEAKADASDLSALAGTVAALSAAFTGVWHTPDGGIALKLTNKTGSASVKGVGVAASLTTNNSFTTQANMYDTFGVVYEAGVPDGEQCLVVFSGRAQVLAENGVAMTRGQILLASTVDGRFTAASPGFGFPSVDTHFKECGHVIESKAAGTNVLTYARLHFN